VNWTLVYNGTEKSLSAWGITADISLALESKAKDVVRVRTVEGFGDTLQWAYDGVVKIKDGDGVTLFQGYVGQPTRNTDGGAEWVEYPIYNAWWLFERLVFKQTRHEFAGWSTPGDPTSGPTYINKYTSEIYVGEKADETYQTNGQQVREVIDWVNECWNPTRRGATSGQDAAQDVVKYPALLTDYPAVNIPKSRLNDVFCHETITNVLRYSPDRPVSWDYSTNPPTLKLVALTDSPEITVTITADQERRMRMSPQYDRQLAGVMIHYKRVNVIDGSLWPEVFVDKFPTTIDDFTPDVSVHTIDLLGASVTRVRADISVKPLADALGADATARKEWWKTFCPELTAYGVDDSSIAVDVATVDGSPDTSIYKNVLLSKAGLADWLNTIGIVGQEATVRAKATFTRYADGPTKKVTSAKHAPKEIHVRVVLTNATTNVYTAVQHSESPESVPVGVAEAVYNSVKDLQHAGSIDLIGDQTKVLGRRDEVRTDIKPGVKLKLVGPTTTFTNCLVQSATIEPHYGRISVVFGPSASLDIQERIELQRVGRFRYTHNMPSGRSDGSAAGGTSVSLENQNPKENTTSQLISDKMQAATSDLGSGLSGVVVKDANQTTAPDGSGISATQAIQMHQVTNSTGVRDDSKGGIDARLSDCLGSDSTRHILKIQEVDICVSGTPKKAMCLISDPY
jgi:hypothetical protein